jgi:zinc protease
MTRGPSNAKSVVVVVALAVLVLWHAQPVRAEPTQASPVKYHVRVLPNGLKVFSVFDPSTPNVAVQVWYGVGAKNDPVGRSGFAHLFEHLMFKGARDMPPEFLARLTDDIGGSNNASTDYDYTEYNEVIPASHLELLLWAEAERMGSLVVDQANFVSERAVVESELRQDVLGDPYGKLLNVDIGKASFTAHPYREPSIGSIADLEAATLADVKAFHKLYYRPDNANLIVVGDFDQARLDAWVDKYFGAIQRPATPVPRVTAVEPQRMAARTTDSYGHGAPQSAVVLTFVAPNAASSDAPALNVLDAIMTTGDSSKLYRSLIDHRHVASEVYSDVDLRQQAGLIAVGALIVEGKTFRQAEGALRDALADLRERPVSQEALRTAKNQLLAEGLRDRETIDGLASEFGQAIIVEGDPARINADLPALQSVTAADVQRVARSYLVDSRRVTIRFHPTPDRPRGRIEAAANAPALAGSAQDGQPSPDAAIDLTAPQLGKPSQPGPVAKLVMPRPIERTLANGLRVIVARTSGYGLTTVQLTFRGGSALDPPGQSGLARMTALLALRAGAGRSASQAARSIEGLGDSFSAHVDYDSSTFSLTGLSASLGPGLSIMADVVRRPTCETAEFRRVQRRVLDDLSDSVQEPDSLTELAVASVLFGRGPYGEPPVGQPRSIAHMTRADLASEREQFYRPNNAILVVTGDLDPDATFALAERAFGDWAKRMQVLPAAKVNDLTSRGRTIVIDLPGSAQATVAIAGRSIGRSDPSHFAVEVANRVLGGGYSSRLNDEVRVKRGLTYDAESTVDEWAGAGVLVAMAQTQNASAPEVAALMLDQIRALGVTPPTAAELAAREADLVGEYGRATETSAGAANILARSAIYGGSESDFAQYASGINAVTAIGVQAAAKRLVDASNTDVLIVGDAKKFLPSAKRRFSNVEVISANDVNLIEKLIGARGRYNLAALAQRRALASGGQSRPLVYHQMLPARRQAGLPSPQPRH